DTLPPPPIDQGRLTVGPVTNGQVTLTGAPGSVEGGARVTLRNTRTGQQVTVVATTAGAFTATLAAQPGDGVTLTVTDTAGKPPAAPPRPVGGSSRPGRAAPRRWTAVSRLLWRQPRLFSTMAPR